MPRLRCPKCGRFAKMKMRSPIYDTSDALHPVVGWNYGGFCDSCFKWVNLTERVK